MRRPVIIELFGRMCQNSPKDGSHLFGQINSKHHGQAFRHLAKGRQRFFGIRPCCIDLPATPSQHTVKMVNTFLQGEGKKASPGAIVPELYISSLWSLLYSDPMRSSWSLKSERQRDKLDDKGGVRAGEEGWEGEELSA